MDAVVSRTTETVLQTAGRVVKQHVGYFFNYNDKFEEVKHYVEMLDNARKRVQNEVNDAEMNAEKIEDDVQLWLKQVGEKIKKYESFLHDERHVKTRCSIGFFPNNLHLRYRLGRNATKMIENIEAKELLNKKFDEVSYRVRPSNDVALANIGYESFESRTKTMEKIMQALEDSTVDRLGVYGVGGVGKTTLVKEVAKKAQARKLFNVVVTANITRNPDVEKIQGQIAEMLGMRLEEESEIVRADRIRKRLKNEKEKTLIILDDLWDMLDLNRLGIPCSDDGDDGSRKNVRNVSGFGYNKMEKDLNRLGIPCSDDGSQQNVKDVSDFGYNKMEKDKLSVNNKGCKILLTSRRKEVICNEMDVQERSTFEVGVIDQKEAETLLKKVGGINSADSVFDGKAIEIAKMCGGMPIALVYIGRVLKNKSHIVWEDVCQQIKRQSFTEGWESVEFSVKLSYDHLKNELLKNIFLHCARMGSDALIMDLVKFCIGMGLLRGVQTIREARNKVNVLIEELKESSLLVGSYSIDHFNMHDIVRDVALSISSKEKNALFMKNDILDEWPHKDELERYTAIFLHYCDINDGLPQSIYCPRLEVLHIDSKHDSLKISDDFFKDMIELRVLVLTGINLSCLPSSIKCLTKLRMLSLERCTLGRNLSIIGELKKLRILTLSGSDIETLPPEFGQLDKLQLFDLSNCSKLRVIPSNTISRMNVLEEFYMRDSLIIWEAEENIQSENASLSELRHLNQLGNLDIHIQSVAHFPQNLFFDMLDGYKIFIGDFKMFPEGEFKIPDEHEMVKFLALNPEDGFDIHSEKWIKMLFKGVEYLLLGELNDVHDVSYELNVEGFPNLKHLSIVNNFSIQYIIKSTKLAFPKLESMFLNKLENLEKICDNHVIEASFCNLKIIKIRTCGRLENLFPFSKVRLLTNLETIVVCDCDSLKEIVFVERQIDTINDDKIEFPQLRILTLQSLPTFTCLYTNEKMSAAVQSLEDQVPNMNEDISTETREGAMDACLSLFNEKVLIPKLESLELSSINIQKIWSDQCLESFKNLLTLNVTDCGNLKYLLSLSMAGSLVNLQSLSINACEMMEDIFRPEEAENIDVFPKLKTMEIICMERLNTIWHPHIGHHSFLNLDSLIIRECHKLVTIYPSYMVQKCQSLQSLTIIDCKLVENIFDFRNTQQTCERIETNLHKVSLVKLPNLVHVWKDDTSEIVKYNNFQSIRVDWSPNLKYLFPLSVANDLEKLECLEVYYCYRMKEIVAWDKGSNENAITFNFPHLKTVSLVCLYELENFYGGAHTIELPSLKNSTIVNTWKLERLTTEITNSQAKPIVLATEKVVYNFEFIGMSLREAQWLQKHVSVHRMHKLQSLILFCLKNSEILFWFIHRLPNLKSLRLGTSHMKRIWVPGSLLSREKIGVVMQLKELLLTQLFCLEDIGFEHDQLLQRVERLVIEGCKKLINLASSSVSFSHLTDLTVVNCRLMRNLMTCSTAKSLVQLTTMKVSFCPMIGEIVAEHEEEKVQEIEFRRLKSLELISLKNLTSFCSSEKCELKFPLLENLAVTKCPQMTQFAKHESAPKLQKVQVVGGQKDKWYWEGDLNDTLQKHFANQVSLEYSEQMRLIDYPKMDGVGRHGKPFPDNFFGCLKKLEFDASCPRYIIIPSHVLPYLKNLEELNVHDCDAAQVIFDINDTKRIVFRLKKLTLKALPNLKCVWNEKPPGMVSFPNLQEVTVDDCWHLGALFPSSIAINLKKLKILDIQKCYKLVEIVGKEDRTTEILFEFPCLSYLVLFSVPLLSCFYPGKYHLECPVLETLDVDYCPRWKLFTSELHDRHKEAVIEGEISNPIQQSLFSVEKVVPKLKRLTLNEENIILLSDGHLPHDLLCKLKILQLCFKGDKNEKNTLPFDFLHKVPSLEQLTLNRCFGLKEIFPSQNLQIHDELLAKLKTLILFNLIELELIGLEHPWVKPYSEKLEWLNVTGCPRLQNIVCCTVSFFSLKIVTVIDCGRMEYLFTFSTARSLEQLEMLDIKRCESIKEIIKKEDEDDSDEIIFGRLTALVLDSLPRLGRFYSGNATLQFSCLQEATVAQCPNMKTFSEGSIYAPTFLGIQTSTEVLFFHDDLNMTICMLFHQQVFFEYSKHMILVDCLEMRRARHINPAFSYNFFGSFKKLEFDGACKRDIIIPSHVLPYLKSLEELNVHGSDAVRVIFDINDNEPNTKRIVFRLKKLTLKALPNLKCVWNVNPRGMISFPNLQQVTVDDCWHLGALFPSSIAINLKKLNTLQIQRCAKLVEIVGKENGTIEILFEFPCLSWLTLWNMPLLNCFYPGKYYLECPVLETLHVAYCRKLKLFTSELHDRNKEAVIEGEVSNPIQQSLFSIEKVVPKLKGLTLNEENIILLSDAHLPQDLLCKLKSLQLCFEDDKNEKNTLPFDFLDKVPSLEQLILNGYFGLKEIFPSQNLQIHDRILAGLKTLELLLLEELELIGLEHPWVKPYSEKLELLKVDNCPQLQNIVCCTVSFISLKKVIVIDCERMEYLFTFSTARSLEQLEILDIKRCESIKEIIKKEDEDDSDEIIFGRLIALVLDSLPRLGRFYSGNATLQFSCLQIATVSKCPNMKTFSEETINAPLFHGIKTSMEDSDDLTFHGDVNSTIKGLFHQQVFLEYSKDVRLVDYPEMKEGVWHDKPAFPDNYCSLKKLDLDEAFEREIVIPSNVLPYLMSLEELNVHGCDAVQVIFDIDDGETNNKGLIVSPLKMITLDELPSLNCVWNKNTQGIVSFPNLQAMVVTNCKSLATMFPSSVARNLVKLQCGVASFINLRELVVLCCKRMEYLFTFSTSKSLVQLEILHIKDCKSLKEIVKKEDEDDSQEIIFGCLTTLMLDSLPRLVRFYSGNATLQFSRLQKAKVVRCPNMNTFSEGSINVPLFHGIQTSVEDSHDLTFQGDLNMTIWILFLQKLYLEYSNHIQLVDYPETKEGNWLSIPALLDLFGSIKKLDIDASSKRNTVIPSNVLPYLKSLEELNVHGSDHAEVIFDIDESEIKTKGIVFPLKKLTLNFLLKLKCLWNKTPQGIVNFPNLKEIFVNNCWSLATLFPSSLARNLVNLETLEIQSCHKMVEIVEKEDTLMELGSTEILFEFPCLSKLQLYKLPLLSCFYHGQHHMECPVLETLHVSYCPKLKLFSSVFHDIHKEPVIEGQVQSQINQTLFPVEKVVPKLKALTLNEENIILFSDGHLPQDLLCKLILLELCFEDKNNKKDALPFDFLHRVPNLEHLKVSKCFGLKEIFHSQKLQVHEGIPTGLKQLSLFNLDELESIGLEHPWVKPYSEKLQMLSLKSCSRLEKLVRGVASFINLKQLVVKSCTRIEYLFTFSTATSLVQLEILDIKGCSSIKEIVKKEDEDDSHEIILGCLTTLMLDFLPRLVRFYSGNATLQFSRLQKAKVVRCPNMNTFSEGSINVPLFQGIQTSVEDSDELTFHDDLNMTIWILFHQMLYLEYSKRIQLVDYPATKEGNWLSKPALLDLFGSIKKLDLDALFRRDIVIPSNVLPYLKSLEELNVHNCYHAKVIFDLVDTRAAMKPASQLSLPLKKLILSHLPNLEHIWNLNPDEILSLQDLQEVHIHSCKSLKSLFPASVANHLVTLEVRHCARLVEIFVEYEAALKGETKQVIFRCLTSLTLWELPELKIFCNGKHSLEWPMLTCLDIYHCDKLELFITKHHSGEVADIKDKLGISIDQQAVFSVEKVFPNLVQLSLKKEDAMAISQEQLQVMPSLEHQEITKEDNMLGQGQFGANAAHLLQNLEVLKLMCYHEDDESSNIFSSGFLEKLPKIENLEVVCSSFNEIFSSQRPSTDCTKILSKLKRLHLNNLQHLNSIGLEHSWVEPLLKTLETLEVFSCPCLKLLVPSTVSFSNLISLNVGECHGLVYLFTSSTAKSLGQLKHMSIQNCKAIQEIVSKEGDQESNDEEIIFVQLNVLSLEYLPSILGIYSGTSKLKFPSLDHVTLTECPQMKYSYVPDLHEFKPQI